MKSCLDLIILSANLMPYLTKVMIDQEQKFSAKKIGMSKGRERIIRSDHFPILIELTNMPKTKVKIGKESSWNLNNPGG